MSIALQGHLLEASRVSINLIISLVQVVESFKILEISSSNPLATYQALITFFPLFIFSVITHLDDTVY